MRTPLGKIADLGADLARSTALALYIGYEKMLSFLKTVPVADGAGRKVKSDPLFGRNGAICERRTVGGDLVSRNRRFARIIDDLLTLG